MISARTLLDTQTFVLLSSDVSSVPLSAMTIVRQPKTDLFLSTASLWELQIKLDIGKLKLPVTLPAAFQKAVTEIGLELLPILPEHIYLLAQLPLYHRDPFDRLLAAQARYEQMPIVGSDEAFDRYGVRRIW